MILWYGNPETSLPLSLTRQEKKTSRRTELSLLTADLYLEPQRELHIRFVIRAVDEVVHDLQLCVFLEVPVEAGSRDRAATVAIDAGVGVFKNVIAKNRLKFRVGYALRSVDEPLAI